MGKRLAFLFGLLLGGFTGYVLGVISVSPADRAESGTNRERLIELRERAKGADDRDASEDRGSISGAAQTGPAYTG